MIGAAAALHTDGDCQRSTLDGASAHGARRGRRRSGRLVPLLLVPAMLLGACSREHPWPPGVQRVPPTSPALPPDAALDTFYMPPGYRLELVASEPMIADPVAIDFDPDGRLWVVEMRGFMNDETGSREEEPVGRIVVLEDDDDDGRMDRSTVFLDGLVLPRTVRVLEHGVLVIAPPHLWLARDTDGDLRADQKEIVRSDFGVAGQNPEHSPNSLLWAMDNWIYTSEHAAALRLRDGRLEHHAAPPRGQWGLSMDDVGRLYRNWNDDPLRVDYLPPLPFLRNPHAVSTRGLYERTTADLEVFAIRPTPAVNRGYREGTLRADGSLAVFVAAGTPVVYRGDRLPSDLYGNVFVTEPGGHLVRRYVLETDARGHISARNPYAPLRAEFLASTDERFRPVNLFSAPDGTLYIVDMYRGVIQHGQYQSEYLKDQIRRRGLVEPVGYGRLYRVVHETTVRDRRPSLRSESSDVLVRRLAHPNGWWRDTAQRLLVERGDRSVLPQLRELAAGAPDGRTRLHALWTIDGLGGTTPDVVERALRDRSPSVRAAGIRLAEAWLREPSHPLHDRVWERRDDGEPAVRWQVALSVGEMPEPLRLERLTVLLGGYGDDPILVDAAISGLSGLEDRVMQALLERGTAHRGVLAALSGAIVRSGRKESIDALFRLAADRAPALEVRAAVLEGIELAQRPAPGTFRRTPVKLPAAPAPLLALSREESDLGRHAQRLLERLDWPGKPATGPRVPPLTPDEQRRFEQGRDVYARLCAACHQPDGRGREGVAPALAGSRWVVGRAGLAARIVLHGKEGALMMPPVGSLSDAEIAAVLTFVRRSFGNAASAVDEALVREARGASAGRQRPWTEAELAAVTQPDGPPPALP